MDDTRTATRRERITAAVKADILMAAAQMFAEKGFHRTTTKQIAEAAGVSEGTIYNYFANKDELLLGIVAHLARSHSESWDENLSLQDARQFFYTVLLHRSEFVDQNYPMLKAILSEILVNPDLSRRYYEGLVVPWIAIVEQQLQGRVDQGQIRALDVPVTARMLMSLVIGLFFVRILEDPLLTARWKELPQLMTDFVFEGLDPSQAATTGGSQQG